MAFLKKDRPSEAVKRAATAHGYNIFYVKYMGAMDVAESKGSHVADSAMNQVLDQCKLCKKTGWKAPKAELNVTLTGLKLTDRASGKIFLDLPLRSVSYCQDDRTTNCYFVFIAREQPDAGCKCFVFKCDNQASDIMRAIGIAFKKAAERDAAAAGRSGSGPASPKAARGWVQGGGGAPAVGSGMGGGGGAPLSDVEMLQRRLQETELENQRLRQQLTGAPPPQSSARGFGFESNFNPAAERAAPLQTSSVKAPAARAVPSGRGALPLVTADRFAAASQPSVASQPRKAAAGGFGFEDSFVPSTTGSGAAPSAAPAASIAGVPAMPPAAARPNKRNENNPYARPRGAMPGAAAAPAHATAKLAPVTAASRSTPPTRSAQEAPPSSQRRGLPMGALLDEFADKSGSEGEEDDDDEEPSADDKHAFENLDDVDDLVNQLAAEQNATEIPYHEHHQEDEPPSAGALLAAGSQMAAGAHPSTSSRPSVGTASSAEPAKSVGTASSAEPAKSESSSEAGGDVDNEQDRDGGDDGEGAEAEGEWAGSETMELVPLCHHVWSMARVSEDGTVDGEQLRQLMMMSQLPTDMLFTIWNMVDTEQAGKLDYRQFGYLMGLLGQAQNGETLDLSLVGPDSKSPHLEGLQAV